MPNEHDHGDEFNCKHQVLLVREWLLVKVEVHRDLSDLQLHLAQVADADVRLYVERVEERLQPSSQGSNHHRLVVLSCLELGRVLVFGSLLLFGAIEVPPLATVPLQGVNRGIGQVIKLTGMSAFHHRVL